MNDSVNRIERVDQGARIHWTREQRLPEGQFRAYNGPVESQLEPQNAAGQIGPVLARVDDHQLRNVYQTIKIIGHLREICAEKSVPFRAKLLGNTSVITRLSCQEVMIRGVEEALHGPVILNREFAQPFPGRPVLVNPPEQFIEENNERYSE